MKAFDSPFKTNTIPGKMECLQVQKNYPVLRTRTWENLKHDVQNFKLKIRRQTMKGNLVKQNLDKGKISMRNMDDWMVYLTNNYGLDYEHEYEILVV